MRSSRLADLITLRAESKKLSLEALRIVPSLAMTRFGTHHPIFALSIHQRLQLCYNDVKRAYFNAKIDNDSDPCFV